MKLLLITMFSIIIILCYYQFTIYTSYMQNNVLFQDVSFSGSHHFIWLCMLGKMYSFAKLFASHIFHVMLFSVIGIPAVCSQPV